MESVRKHDRIIVDIAVTLTTVLDSLDGRIIDLSENGAQITGASLPRGTKFQIEYQGQTIYAQCMWSEVDRMGIRFPFRLMDGPLYDVMAMSVTARLGDVPSLATNLQGMIRRPASMDFGRRSQI